MICNAATSDRLHGVGDSVYSGKTVYSGTTRQCRHCRRAHIDEVSRFRFAVDEVDTQKGWEVKHWQASTSGSQGLLDLLLHLRLGDVLAAVDGVEELIAKQAHLLELVHQVHDDPFGEPGLQALGPTMSQSSLPHGPRFWARTGRHPRPGDSRQTQCHSRRVLDS